ncbi:hypothetical protein L1785_18275 [Antribacter sp. KLBMP9083]|uniref:Uncharacterized protein n=1 Tax=Antribacter soli TaxID=2910976 RepID=A0AA41QGA8_9MICO|nr:hypothetical protein [Antribacter soli]MCF4122928.1 hypothetical protein [Antribacter soli]
MTHTTGSPEPRPHLAQARAALEAASQAEASAAVGHLARARALLDEALDEAMAEAVLSGESMRAVAEAAGVAPNTVPPRLARTSALAAYGGHDGRVTSGGVTRARYDRERGQEPPEAPAVEPLRFRRRT